MSTTTLRLDEPLKRRLASLALSAGRTPHSLMVEALEQKADEMEAHQAFARVAAKRDEALQAGIPGIELHDMKIWLRANVKARVAAAKSVKAKARAK